MAQAALSPRPTDLVGRTLGRYRLVAKIAEGGMAEVYRGELVDGAGVAAVKVLRPDLIGDMTYERRFRREAELASSLSHPNIVKTLEYGAEGRNFYVAMELLEGEDTLALMARHKEVDQTQTIKIVASVCDALGHAHRRGIVHRDLKPENVFLQKRGDGFDVKVLDFGIAKMFKATRIETFDGPSLTSMGSVVGTPQYMSPEQCRSESAAPASDVYACGVLLYSMLTGAPPFVARNPVQVMLMHMRDKALPPSAFRPGVSAALDKVVMRALSKDPRDRQASADELAAELRALLPAKPRPAAPRRPNRREAKPLDPRIAMLMMAAVTFAVLAFRC